MNKYKDRHLKRMIKAVNIAYLTTAILWGTATLGFSIERQNLKEDYSNNEITREEFLEKSMEFTDTEEIVFGTLTMALSTIFLTDLALKFPEIESEK